LSVRTMATCNKGCLFWLFFFTISLIIAGYLFYVGWWIPIELHKHSLRYNQLEPFEIYGVPKSQWFHYHMDTQPITVVSYLQHRPFDYEYYLSSAVLDNPENKSISNGLISATWDEFAEMVNNNDTADLLIIQLSRASCQDGAACFIQYINAYGTDIDLPTTPLMYTRIENECAVGVNSEIAGTLLDSPRDGFQFFIMLLFSIWLIVLLEFFDDNETETATAWTYMSFVLFLVLGYYLWVFTLCVVPVLFATPIKYGDTLDYWELNEYSITYTVGDFDANWWVSGVMLHGIWQWFLVLTWPATCGIYMLLMCLCCCKEQRTIVVGKLLVIPCLLLASAVIVFSCIAYIPIFIGNVKMWNELTFANLSEIHVENGYNDDAILALQCFVAFAAILIVVPVFACALSCIGKHTERERDSQSRIIHKVSRSMRKLPVIGDGPSSPKPNTAGYDKVEMQTNGFDVYA